MNQSAFLLQDVSKWEMTSTNTQHTYDIWIFTPQISTRKSLPVLYVLDGQWDFALFHSVYGVLKYDGFVDELLIVGISYRGSDEAIHQQRSKDYNIKATGGSGVREKSTKFIEFFRSELIPKITQEYATEPGSNLLAGASHGGTFALYCMLTQQNLFQKYIVASPALAYGDQCIFDTEESYYHANSQLPVRLYISIGQLETNRTHVLFEQFKNTLVSRQYESFDFVPSIISGERHAGLKPETFNRGLRYVMSPAFIQLPLSVLKMLTGKYWIQEHGIDLNVFIEDGQLRYSMSANNLDVDDLLPVSERCFLARRSILKIMFTQCCENHVFECELTSRKFSGRAVRV